MSRNIGHEVFCLIGKDFFVDCVVIEVKPGNVSKVDAAVGSRFFIGCKEANLGASFDGHVGNGEAFVDSEFIDRRAAEFKGFIRTTGSGQIAQDAQGNIL